MSDTIFVLGAGFSSPARMPVQADLMREIVKRASQVPVRKTIGSLFNVFQIADMAQVPLEDIFTMLDRARTAGETIPGFSHEQLNESHTLLLSSIAEEFKRRLSSFRRDCYEKFFSELIDRRVADGSEEARRSSPFSLFTLNWDTIPDYFTREIGGPRNVASDYGTYDHALNDEQWHLPSPVRHPSGQFTFKLLKLHGSLNWLSCSSCGRLFCSNTATNAPSVLRAGLHRCRFCKTADLQSMLVMPTLLKDFRNVHLRMIWHSALLELQAARRLLFIGYSLPLADFEFRYLLLRGLAARHDISIRVVLYPPDSCIRDDKQRFERSEVEQRYRRFFGNRDIEFKLMNAANFMVDPVLLWNW